MRKFDVFVPEGILNHDPEDKYSNSHFDHLIVRDHKTKYAKDFRCNGIEMVRATLTINSNHQWAEPKKTIKGKTAEEYMEWLESTLIPDLKESGSVCTAEDLETCIKWIRYFKA